LVNVLDVYIDPLETKAFCPLRGGFLHFTGKIGLIFSLADPDPEGEWIDGRCSFDVHMELNTDLIDEESLHCLTLFVRNNNATIINCLQLELLKPSLRDYKRVVLLKVSLDLKYTLLQEIK
jgi:hypothetical protein